MKCKSCGKYMFFSADMCVQCEKEDDNVPF